jgi:hypothetical protein
MKHWDHIGILFKEERFILLIVSEVSVHHVREVMAWKSSSHYGGQEAK